MEPVGNGVWAGYIEMNVYSFWPCKCDKAAILYHVEYEYYYYRCRLVVCGKSNGSVICKEAHG